MDHRQSSQKAISGFHLLVDLLFGSIERVLSGMSRIHGIHVYEAGSWIYGDLI